MLCHDCDTLPPLTRCGRLCGCGPCVRPRYSCCGRKENTEGCRQVLQCCRDVISAAGCQVTRALTSDDALQCVFPRPDTSAAGSVWRVAACEAAPRCTPAAAETRATRAASECAGGAGGSGARGGTTATRRHTTRSPRDEQKIYFKCMECDKQEQCALIFNLYFDNEMTR